MPIFEEDIKKYVEKEQLDIDLNAWEKSGAKRIFGSADFSFMATQGALKTRVEKSDFWRKQSESLVQIITYSAIQLDHSYKRELRRDEINTFTGENELVVNHCLSTAFWAVHILDTYHQNKNSFDKESQDQLERLLKYSIEILIEALFHDYEEDGKGTKNDIWGITGAGLQFFVSKEEQKNINTDLPLLNKQRIEIITEALAKQLGIEKKFTQYRRGYSKKI
jgi:hypothetical protein